MMTDVKKDQELDPMKKKNKEQFVTEEARKQLDSLAKLRIQNHEAERNRKKDEKERKKRREAFKRKKRMLEACFEGDLAEIGHVLEEINVINTEQFAKDEEINEIIKRYNKFKIIECEDNYGNTPLSEAAGGGQPEVIRMLVKEGAMPNHKGLFNRTPLYRAAFSGHLRAVEMLLEAGADPTIQADDGQTPSDVAASKDITRAISEWDLEKTRIMLLRQAEVKTVRQEEDKKRREHDIHILEEQAREFERQMFIRQRELEQQRGVQNFGYSDGDSWFGNSVRDGDLDDNLPGERINIKNIEDEVFRDIHGKIEKSGKWPLIIDPSQKAATFLRYKDTYYINALSGRTMEKERIRMTLVGALRFGKGVVLDFMGSDSYDMCVERFDEVTPGLMMKILNKSILDRKVYAELVTETDGEDYMLNKFNQMRVNNFSFYIITQTLIPNEKLTLKSYLIRITDK